MGLAVALDDQPPVDEEVDPPDARDRHLALDVETESPEHEAQDALAAGLGRRIHEAEQHALPLRQAPRQVRQAVLVEKPPIQGGVQRGDRRCGPLTLHGIGQRVEQFDVRDPRPARAVPVHPHPPEVSAQAAGAGRDPHMQHC